jgi:hypothetical protein
LRPGRARPVMGLLLQARRVNFKLTYIPRGINAPRACDIHTKIVYAINARHAAIRAATFERRSGARVLTVVQQEGMQ